LSSFDSIRAFVKEYKELQIPSLNILINNAGVMACDRMLTKDGHEMQFGTNHLGHFLLTELLLPEFAAGGRVIMVSSTAHGMSYKEGIRFDDLKGEEKYSKWGAYGQSKLANLLYAKALEERFQASKIETFHSMHAFSLHPGVIKTELGRHMSPFMSALFSLGKPFCKTIPQGAATTVYCALAPELNTKGGQYFADCNEEKPKDLAVINSATWQRLVEVSRDLTGLKS